MSLIPCFDTWLLKAFKLLRCIFSLFPSCSSFEFANKKAWVLPPSFGASGRFKTVKLWLMHMNPHPHLHPLTTIRTLSQSLFPVLPSFWDQPGISALLSTDSYIRKVINFSYPFYMGVVSLVLTGENLG